MFFDYAPSDIIRSNILPFLDLESRISLNRIVAPECRYAVRMSKEVIHNHEYATLLMDYAQYHEDCSNYIWNDKYKQQLLARMYGRLTNIRVMEAYCALLKKDIFTLDPESMGDRLFRAYFPTIYNTEFKQAHELYKQIKAHDTS